MQNVVKIVMITGQERKEKKMVNKNKDITRRLLPNMEERIIVK